MVEMTPKWLRSNVVRFFKRRIFRQTPECRWACASQGFSVGSGPRGMCHSRKWRVLVQYPHGCEMLWSDFLQNGHPYCTPKNGGEIYIYHSQRRLLRSIWTTWRCQGHLAVHVPKGLLPNRGTVKDRQLQDWGHLMAHRMDWWRQFTSCSGCWCWQSRCGGSSSPKDPQWSRPQTQQQEVPHRHLNFHSTYLHIASEEAPGATRFLVTQIVLLCFVQDLGSCSGPKQGEVATVGNARLPNVPLEVTRLCLCGSRSTWIKLGRTSWAAQIYCAEAVYTLSSFIPCYPHLPREIRLRKQKGVDSDWPNQPHS